VTAQPGGRPDDRPAARAGAGAAQAGVTEAVLVARAQAGDMGAFEDLVMTYADRLFAVLLRMLGDRSEAEDVAQEVILRAWRGIGGFRGNSSFFTWLYRIAINEANRSLQKTARRPLTVPVETGALQIPADDRDEPSRRAEQQELRTALASALASLPPDYRAAIVLRDIEGLSTREAADIAGIGQAAFKSRLHQARLRVRAAVGDDALVSAG
jgi:RNA polymerase sigma-70 factor, ECF subfamily